jgi:hypothetical protein
MSSDVLPTQLNFPLVSPCKAHPYQLGNNTLKSHHNQIYHIYVKSIYAEIIQQSKETVPIQRHMRDTENS